MGALGLLICELQRGEGVVLLHLSKVEACLNTSNCYLDCSALLSAADVML